MTNRLTREQIAAALRRTTLFAELAPADLDRVVAATQVLSKRRGMPLCDEGTVGDACYVVVSGRLKVVLSGRDGNEIILGMVEPSSVIGEIALLDNSVRSAGLVAVEDCLCLRVPRACFQALRQLPAFEERLVAHVTATLRRATEQLRAIYTFDVVERVGWCLAQLARQRGQVDGATVRLTPKPTHQALADMAGCSRETASRALTMLKARRRVSWDAASLRIDRQFLASYYAQAVGMDGLSEVARLV